MSDPAVNQEHATHEHAGHHAAAGLHAAPQLTVPKEVKFSFKKAELEGTRRPPVQLIIPILTMHGFIEYLQKDEKIQELALELVNNEIKLAARSQVDDETKPVNGQDELDVKKLDLIYIVNQPKSERRGNVIPKEVWEAFAKNYVENMPRIANITADAATKAAQVFVQKLRPVAGNKPVIKLLGDRLKLWFTSVDDEAREEFGEIYEFLKEKVSAFSTEELTVEAL